MSDQYGLQDTEFRTKTLPVILNELEDTIESLMGGRVSLQEDDPLYQFLLAIAQREERLWRLADTLFQLMSLSGASGLALDRHGEDLALPRGGATYATTNLLITGTPGNDIPSGSIFQTSEGVQFETTEAAELPATITVARSTLGNRDTLTSPYSGLVTVDWVSDSASGESPYTQNVDYIVDEDVIDWSPAGIQPAAGDNYYVRVSDSISVTVAIQSLETGSNQNVPANTITEAVSDVGGISSVNNSSSTGTTGADSESGTDYKLRLLRAGRRNWTAARIQSKIEELSGVASCKIIIGESIDQNNSEETHTVERETLGQLFRPGERVGNISSVEFQVRVFGTPGDLMVELYRCQLDVLANINYESTVNSSRLAYARVSATDIDPYRTTDWFEHNETLKYNHLDNTRRYLLRIYCTSDNSTNYYEFRYGTSGAYTYGGLYRDGVLYADENLWFRTLMPNAAFTTVIAPTTTLTDDLRDEIEETVTASGRAVGIQHVVEEATVISIQVQGRLKIDEDNYTFVEIQSGIETRIYNYLTALDIGDDVVWAEVLATIMAEPGVKDVDAIQIYYMRPEESTFTALDETDNLLIGDREIARQATVGVIFSQFWSAD